MWERVAALPERPPAAAMRTTSDLRQGDRFMARVIGCLLVISVLTLSSAAAQTPEGSIRGYARDEQGAMLPGVTITARAANAVTYTAVSDAGGFYRLQNVVP